MYVLKCALVCPPTNRGFPPDFSRHFNQSDKQGKFCTIQLRFSATSKQPSSGDARNYEKEIIYIKALDGLNFFVNIDILKLCVQLVYGQDKIAEICSCDRQNIRYVFGWFSLFYRITFSPFI
jgi:hypothetical protein